jgi:hypothetical protein
LFWEHLHAKVDFLCTSRYPIAINNDANVAKQKFLPFVVLIHQPEPELISIII